LKKWQAPVAIIALLAVVAGMNVVADWRREQAEKKNKELEKKKLEAELLAKVKEGNPHGLSQHGGAAPAFKLPPPSGPAGAPVKVEIFVNNTNECHVANTALTELPKIYGSLVRLEWHSIADPKVAERADKLQIGCEAGILINGKIEMEVPRLGGKMFVSFRGPLGDKYKLPDVYAAINQALQAKGKKPPAAALAKAQSS